ncbi:hypothetical protein DSO57_1018422 [Entomophthora muscae]|uniref:Uncharacterized protein n=1 Tax=Entomophthora muscae TaxID=34485 RepID=A0ACC2TFB1_9FUNG|nr:hypothetical protein DSO57_1018422 [Entomophthora muscae]
MTGSSMLFNKPSSGHFLFSAVSLSSSSGKCFRTTVLVDTGAMHNFLSQKFMDQLGWEYLPGIHVRGGLLNNAPPYQLRKPLSFVASGHQFVDGFAGIVRITNFLPLETWAQGRDSNPGPDPPQAASPKDQRAICLH